MRFVVALSLLLVAVSAREMQLKMNNARPRWCGSAMAAAVFTHKIGRFQERGSSITAFFYPVHAARVSRVLNNRQVDCCLLEDMSAEGSFQEGPIVCRPEQEPEEEVETVSSRNPHRCAGPGAAGIFKEKAGSYYVTDAGLTLADIPKSLDDDLKKRAAATVKGADDKMCCLYEDLSSDVVEKGDIICRKKSPKPPTETVSSITPHRCAGPGAAGIFKVKAGEYYTTDAGVTIADVKHASAEVRKRAAATVKGADDKMCCLFEDLSSQEVERGEIICGIPEPETVSSIKPHRCAGPAAASIFKRKTASYYVTDAGLTLAEVKPGLPADLKKRTVETIKGSPREMCCLYEDLSSDTVEQGDVICKEEVEDMFQVGV